MSTSLPTRYDFAASEEALYAMWEDGKYFQPETTTDTDGVSFMSKPREERPNPFCVMMPPPNATGILHLGHAARMTTEDIMTRYHRMTGKPTLFLPGTDHAGIATQSKVEHILLEEEGKTRHDLGREAFLERVEAFVQDSQDTIRNQVRRTGASCDWSREAYTFSPKLNKGVNEIFARMFKDGLIYRGARSINWDPKLKTNVSDDEVEYKEEKSPFYTFQYGPFQIGTVRPETKFGDKYVVVHPEDERYAQYTHGDTFECEWINGPITATIIKDEAADPEAGTGAMTITPWHSQVDFEIAQRHNLDIEQVIDLEGKLLPIAQEFAGMPIEEARQRIVEKLEQKGLIVSIDEDYTHNVATNYRGGGVIEPQVMKQWFVDVNKPAVQVNWKPGEMLSIKEALQSAVRDEQIQILPERFNKTYFSWIDNLRDWNISRQLWWGHRIPIWYPEGAVGDETQAVLEEDKQDGVTYVQDEDTLDTWFSSMLWTFSAHGWPEETDDLEYFHPTSVLETAYDILFFWVARMILASTYARHEVPFKTVYLSGLIRDRSGAKMSKSKGNGIDPLEMIDKYGADAVRLSLIVGTTPGNDSRLYEEKIKGYRNFSTKLWNIARFILNKFPDVTAAPTPVTLADNWILSRLAAVRDDVTTGLDTYNLGVGGETLYAFAWHEVADWYIELLKDESQNDSGPVARFVLEELLKLLHPYTPFITEEIWKHLEKPEALIVTAWPTPLEQDKEVEAAFNVVTDMIEATRSIRGTLRIPAEKELTASTTADLSEEQRRAIAQLARIQFEETPREGASVIAHGRLNALTLSIEGAVDLEAERSRLTEELQNEESHSERIQKKLSNTKFVEGAPTEIVQKEREKLERAEHKIGLLKGQLEQLG